MRALLLLSLPLFAQAPPAPDPAPLQATPFKPSHPRDPFAVPQQERDTEGMDLLDDITVKGWVRFNGRAHVVVSDRRGNVRWLTVGHRFMDGEVVAITESQVTFHQWDAHNPRRTGIRTVVKSFKREEGKP